MIQHLTTLSVGIDTGNELKPQAIIASANKVKMLDLDKVLNLYEKYITLFEGSDHTTKGDIGGRTHYGFTEVFRLPVLNSITASTASSKAQTSKGFFIGDNFFGVRNVLTRRVETSLRRINLATPTQRILVGQTDLQTSKALFFPDAKKWRDMSTLIKDCPDATAMAYVLTGTSSLACGRAMVFTLDRELDIKETELSSYLVYNALLVDHTGAGFFSSKHRNVKQKYDLSSDLLWLDWIYGVYTRRNIPIAQCFDIRNNPGLRGLIGRYLFDRIVRKQIADGHQLEALPLLQATPSYFHGLTRSFLSRASLTRLPVDFRAWCREVSRIADNVIFGTELTSNLMTEKSSFGGEVDRVDKKATFSIYS